MTTIAFDGKTLAADRRACNSGLIFSVTKVFKLRGHLVGAAGDFDLIQEWLAWFSAGAIPEKLPAFQRLKDDYIGALVIDPAGVIYKFERGPLPFKVESPFYAIGSGRDYAMAAMHLGKSAAEAIAVSSALDAGTGNGVDTLTLEPSL